MTKNNFKTNIFTSLVLLAVMSVGCVKQLNPIQEIPPITSDEVFDFSTTKSYNLNLEYDVVDGYKVGFDVYAENPFTISAQGELIKNSSIRPIDKGFTNGKGEYSSPIIIPTYVKTIYIHTKDVGVNPRFFVAQIENGVLGKVQPALYTAEVMNSTKSAATRIGINENIKVGEKGMNFKTKHLLLSEWYQGSNTSGGGSYTNIGDGVQVRIAGRPVNMSYADYSKFGAGSASNNALNIPADIWDKINIALPGDGNAQVDMKYLNDGNIHVSKNDTELDLIFMDQQALYNNTLAYYCYPTNNPPQSTKDIKYPVVAIANGMVQKWVQTISSSYESASLYKGEGVKLKYVDQNGTMSDKFPAGTSVGWILYRNGYSAKTITVINNIPVFTITEGVGANYSSAALTEQGRYNTAVLRVGDFVVLGFDDGAPTETKRDYLDLVFHVKASPSDAITDPIPDVDPEDKITYIEKTGVLAFEDLWPYQGDFDMNDVVVKYHSKIGINKDNGITNIEDKFTLLWCGASFNNGFSYTIDGVSKDVANVTFEGSAADCSVDGIFADLTVHLFKNINKGVNSTNPSVIVKTQFKTPISKNQLKYAPYNTYITIDDAKNTGKETHLTNNKPINPEVVKWFGKGDDRSSPIESLYFITFIDNLKQQLPFAIHMPGSGNPDNDFSYVISQEGKRIDNYYPKFINWINTKGAQDSDWFQHPIK